MTDTQSQEPAASATSTTRTGRSDPSDPKTASTGAADFADRWSAFWAEPDPASLGTLSHPEIVLHWPGRPEPIVGLDHWQAQVAGTLERFPDLRLRVTAHARSGSVVFIGWEATATVDGRTAVWEGVDRMRLVGGLVVESTVVFDTAALRGRSA
ncbi:nuclear transport factor 2 family protein [Kitasatospora sp. NBC_00315]|uniref:nuclear transport factor 2 family protein n=1 Tax=Kitasatospora sp. NBC_00315 TaxID=2975963 RepID=UPI00324E436B